MQDSDATNSEKDSASPTEENTTDSSSPLWAESSRFRWIPQSTTEWQQRLQEEIARVELASHELHSREDISNMYKAILDLQWVFRFAYDFRQWHKAPPANKRATLTLEDLDL